MLLKLLNIHPTETRRVFYAWVLRFMLKIGFIIGWSTTVALFVSYYPTVWLPLFFLIQALLSIAGILLFSFFLKKYSIKTLITFCVIASALLFLMATLFFQNPKIFFSLILIGHSVFLAQVVILVSSHIEHFFSATESQRIAPIIESADVIAGIIGGGLISFLFYHLADARILYLWSFCLFAFLGILFLYPEKQHEEHPLIKKIKSNGLSEGLKDIRRFPFLTILAFFVCFQWMMAQLFEFQFTKIVADATQNFSSTSETASHISHAFGSFHMILNGSALTVQLLISSRIAKRIKGFGAFLLHAIVTFFSLISFFFGFGTFTAFLARNNFEVTSIIHKNAYEVLYYAFQKDKPFLLREFFEGLIMPVSVAIAMGLVALIEFFFLPEHFTTVLHLLLFFLAGGMVITSYTLHKKHEKYFAEKLFPVAENSIPPS